VIKTKVQSELSWDNKNPKSHGIKYFSIIQRIKNIPSPYVGNKKKLLLLIGEIIEKYNLQFSTFLDAFSGTSVVGLFMKGLGKRVHSNDVLTSAYCQATALIENKNTTLSKEDIKYLLENDNPNASTFVQDCWAHKNGNKSCRRFTVNEAKQLDKIKANIKYRYNRFEQSITFCAINLLCMRLPFGFIDASLDIYKHRRKQIEKYGKGREGSERRIGLYYDENLDLNFQEWFPKYVRMIQKNVADNHYCVATNSDIIDLLELSPVYVDCVYFDPPYGGDASDYGTLYRFFEEYIYEEKLEHLPHYKALSRFSNKKNYEKNFIRMLEAAQKIPIWILSCNDSSWEGLDYIVRIIKRFRKNVTVDSVDYSYKYRTKKKKNKEKEHLIVAR